MQRKSNYNLGNVVAEGVMRAAADRLFDLGKTSKDIDTEALCVELRKEAHVALDNILNQGKTLLDSGNSGWVEALVKVTSTG